MLRFTLKPFQRTLICISLDSDESTEMMKVVKAAIEARFTFCKKVLSRFISKFSHSDSSECLFFEKKLLFTNLNKSTKTFDSRSSFFL